MKTAANIARFSLRFLPFTMLLHFSLKKNSPKFASATTRKWGLIASCCSAFCRKTHCNMHQNAVHFAPKRNAICTKMQCILHQNAGCFDANGLAASLNCNFIRCYAGLL